MITPMLAAKAYQAVQAQGLGDLGGGAAEAGGVAGSSFGDILKG